MNPAEEAELIRSVEQGEWIPVANLDAIKAKLIAAASETAAKDCRIQVKISKRDAETLKTRALEEGIPYQTLLSSILHKYATGRMIENKGTHS